MDENLLSWTRREPSELKHELKHFKDERERLWVGRADFLKTMYVKETDGKGINLLHAMVVAERKTFYTHTFLL